MKMKSSRRKRWIKIVPKIAK